MEAVNRAVAAPDILVGELWKETRPVAPNLSFLYPPHSRSLQVNLDLVSRNWELSSEFEIGSSRRYVSWLVVPFKRAIRALTRWYVNPIVHQERKFNMLVTRTLHDVGNNISDIEDRLGDLEEERAELEKRLSGLEKGEGPGA